MMLATLKRFLALLTLSLLGICTAAHAAYPDRPIKIIVPWAAGGNVDFVGRIVALKLSAYLGQTVYVDNVTGASGTIGAGQVAKAAPDGYTLLVNSVTHVIVGSLLPHVPYDPIADFTPIGQVSSVPFVMVAQPAAPFDTVPQFIDWARRQPAGVAYGSAGIGSTNHLAAALFASLTNLDLRHIPYKGSAPALLDVYNGQLPIMFDATTGVVGAIRAGKLKPIAMASPHRSPLYPQLPTFAESGQPEMNFATWHGLYAPAGTPAAVVERLSHALAQVAADADFQQKLRDAGAEVTFTQPAAFLHYNRAERQRWAEIVRKVGATSN
ncbi:MAG TPA: tripartite tricarboxylate transporter substrate binding protein [Burkholderiaceae bacterium]